MSDRKTKQTDSTPLSIQILKVIGIALLCTVVTAFFRTNSVQWREPPLEPGDVRIETIKEWEEILWIDARTTDDYEAGHLDGALSLNEEEWEERLIDIFEAFLDNPDRPIVVYCDGTRCDRSRHVAERLRREIDGAEIFVLKGDWKEWSKR